MGGSPSGLMSARGAADFLTRSTTVLATLFVSISILLAFLAASRHAQSVDTSLARGAAAPISVPGAPPPALTQAPSAADVAAAAAKGNSTAPASNSAVPLEQ